MYSENTSNPYPNQVPLYKNGVIEIRIIMNDALLIVATSMRRSAKAFLAKIFALFFGEKLKRKCGKKSTKRNLCKFCIDYFIFLNNRFHLTPWFQLIQMSQASPTT